MSESKDGGSSPQRPQRIGVHSTDGKRNVFENCSFEGLDVGFRSERDEDLQVINTVFSGMKSGKLEEIYGALGVAPGSKPAELRAALEAVLEAKGDPDKAVDLVKASPLGLTGKITGVTKFVIAVQGLGVAIGDVINFLNTVV